MEVHIETFKSLSSRCMLLYTIPEYRDWIERCTECIQATIEFRRKNLLLENSKRRRLLLVIKRLKLLRIGVRRKVKDLNTEGVLRNELLMSSSSSDDEIYGNEYIVTLSEDVKLDDETLVIETLKIRETVGIQSLCEAAWTSIFNYGVEFLHANNVM